jgi:hypothetical protein
VNSRSNGISCLERIFIENKIYRDIEEKQLEDVIQAVDDGLKPHIKHLKRGRRYSTVVRYPNHAYLKFDAIRHKIKLKL